MAAAVIMVVAFMVMPAGTNGTILIILTLAAGILTYMARGSMFAIPSELKILVNMRNNIRCRMCDWLLPTYLSSYYGYWLDKFGNAGYRNIFVYAAVVMVIGVINAIVMIYKKKNCQEKQQKLKDPENRMSRSLRRY